MRWHAVTLNSCLLVLLLLLLLLPSIIPCCCQASRVKCSSISVHHYVAADVWYVLPADG